MRFTDVVAALPQVVLVIVIAALWGRGSATLVVLTIALTTWMGTARLTRVEALRVGTSDFVIAARATGAGAWRVTVRHYLPHLLPVLLVAATLRVANAILLETSLGFLGLGLPSGTPTWGRTVWEGLAGLRESWWISVAAGSAITITTIGFNLLGDGLRDLLSDSGR
jgi:peptide/nickel transport system permease protein